MTNEHLQDPRARPMSDIQITKLKQHPATDCVWTELDFNGNQLFWIRLKDGWNYESRPNVLGITFNELMHNLGNVERGKVSDNE